MRPRSVMMLMIPPIPSASYFDEGLVMTSMFFIEFAGMLRTTSLKLRSIMDDDLPFTSTL